MQESSRVWTVPNVITIGRICFCPVLAGLIVTSQHELALAGEESTRKNPGKCLADNGSTLRARGLVFLTPTAVLFYRLCLLLYYRVYFCSHTPVECLAVRQKSCSSSRSPSIVPTRASLQYRHCSSKRHYSAHYHSDESHLCQVIPHALQRATGTTEGPLQWS